MKNKSLPFGLLLSSIVLMPGCWGDKKKPEVQEKQEKAVRLSPQVVRDGSKELVFMDGEVIITAKMLEAEFEQLLNENPQIKQVLPFMPDAKKNFLIGLANQRIIERYIEANNIDQQADYQRELERVQRATRHMLNTKFFSAAHPVQVTDAEVSSFYEKHKTAIPDLLVSRGGVVASGVKFTKEADAKVFVAAADKKDFAAVAQERNKKIEDFKVVNNQTVGIDAALKNSIAAMKKAPAVQVVKASDNSYWAVHASKIEEPKYRELEQIKPNLIRMVEQEKQKEVLQKVIDELKAEYNVVIKDDYFAAQAPAAQQAVAIGDAAQVKANDAETSAPQAVATV